MGPSGTDALALPRVDRPELEIQNDRTVLPSTSIVPIGLDAQADSATIRRISIYGFGNFRASGSSEGNVRVGAVAGALVEKSIIGTGAASFTDPGVAERTAGNNLSFQGSTGPIVRDNLIGYAAYMGLLFYTGSVNALAEGNEIRGNGIDHPNQDGISIESNAASGTLRGNLIVGTEGCGVELLSTAGANTVVNNTITGNGVGTGPTVETPAVRVAAAGNRIDRNIINANFGTGVMIKPSSSGNVITKNSIFANGTITNKGGGGPSAQFGIDLLIPTDDAKAGTPPFLSPNDGVLDPSPGNSGMDYPVFTSASLVGSQLAVAGYVGSAPNQATFANASVEVFKASEDGDNNGEIVVGDGLSVPHGEGRTYLGTLVADASGNFSGTLTVSGVAAGDRLTGTAAEPGGSTSEFGANVTVAGQILDGNIYEDVNGNGSVGDDGVGRGSVTVRLYRDGGDGEPDGVDDLLVGTTTTDTAGHYAISATNGVYWLAVDSKTVSPSAGLKVGSVQGDVWAEQTYGAAGSVRRTGAVYSYTGAAGAFFGGMLPSVSDDAAALASTEHVLRAVAAGANVSGLDAGFSFNAVTSIRGGDSADDDVSASRTVQGSLRQFIRNANAVTGANAMRFVPVQAANVTSGSDSWWRIVVSNALPQIADASTTIDGRAYVAADGVTIRDTNTGQLGTGGTVGIDAVVLAKVDKPELEIQGDRTGTPVSTGLDVGANSATIRRVSIYGFGNGVFNNNHANIGVRTGISGAVVDNNVVGAGAGAFTGPGAANRTDGANILLDGGINGTVNNNLIGFATGQGIYALRVGPSIPSGWTVTGNEVRVNDLGTVASPWYFLAGIEIDAGSNYTISQNLIVGQNATGISLHDAVATDIVRNNSITGNGLGAPPNQTSAVRVGGGTGGLIDKNIVTANVGAGVLVTSGATGITVSRNSIYDNGLVSGQIGIDLLTPSDGAARGTSPFVTLNAAGARTGGNNLLNFPVFDTAVVAGGNLTLTGWSKPGSVIEVFLSDSTSGFGEGKTYLTSFTEGVLDGDPATGNSYGPGTVHGVSQGTDTTNRFSFTIPTPSGVSYGKYLTATATDTSGNTSEFSANFLVNSAPVLTGANNLTTIAEDPPTNDPGTAVSALIAGMVTDDDPITGSGIAVTGAATGNGSWEYSLNGGSNWLPLGSPSPSVARLLDDSGPTRLRFVPNADWNGTLVGGLTFRAWDRSRGDSGDTYDTTDNGGSSAFSAATASSDITVSPVADTPSVTPATTPEDAPVDVRPRDLAECG